MPPFDFSKAMSDPRVALGIGLLTTRTPQEGIAQGIGLLSQQSELERQRRLDDLERKYKEAQIKHLDDPESAFGKLIKERNSLPEGSPERALFDAQIKKENTVTAYGYPMPVIGPDGKPTFAARGDILSGDYKPMSSVPKPPSGFAFDVDENGNQTLVPVAGGPADPALKVPTEFQAKSGIYASRIENSNSIIADKSGRDDVNPWEKTKASIPLLGNYLVSDDYQKVDQAKRDFVNATLRQESGATITPAEFNNAEKQYFPQPGDSKEVIEQKARNRQIVLEEMRNNAGSAYAARKSGRPSSITTTPDSSPSSIDPGLEAELRRRGLLK